MREERKETAGYLTNKTGEDVVWLIVRKVELEIWVSLDF